MDYQFILLTYTIYSHWGERRALTFYFQTFVSQYCHTCLCLVSPTTRCFLFNIMSISTFVTFEAYHITQNCHTTKMDLALWVMCYCVIFGRNWWKLPSLLSTSHSLWLCSGSFPQSSVDLSKEWSQTTDSWLYWPSVCHNDLLFVVSYWKGWGAFLKGRFRR